MALNILGSCIFCENDSVGSNLSVTVLNLLMLIVNLSGTNEIECSTSNNSEQRIILGSKVW